MFDEDTLEAGEVVCVNGGERLEFELSDLSDDEEDDED